MQEKKHTTGTKGTPNKLHVLTKLASKACEPCKMPYETPQSMAALKGSCPALGHVKLHLITFSHIKNRKWCDMVIPRFLGCIYLFIYFLALDTRDGSSNQVSEFEM